MSKAIIFDIGMHKGEDTRHYLQQGYKVIAVEANPFLVKENELKFKKEVDSGQLVILNVGISHTEGTLPFYQNLFLSEWSSFDKKIGTRDNTDYTIIHIPCITTTLLFKDYGIPYYMKVDIEGLDYVCLLAIPATGEKPKFVSFEASEPDWLDIVYNKGYRKFKLINQSDNFTPLDLNKERNRYYQKYHAYRNNFKRKLQKVVPLKHPYGSSGPFGEQTKGDWKTYEEIAPIYERLFLNNTQSISHLSWFDLHATF